MKKVVLLLKINMYVPLLILAFLVIPFIISPFSVVIEGFVKILLNPSVLTTDFVYVGGLAATFFSVGVNTLMNFMFVKKFSDKLTGATYAGLLSVIGFSFFGKNIFNTIPIQIGVYLYAKVSKSETKKYMPTALFATGLAPLVSYTMFGLNLFLAITIPLAILLGIVAGFIIPIIAAKTVTFYDGLNILNVGFALCLVATFFHAVYSLVGVDIAINSNVSDSNHWHLFVFLSVISVGLVIASFLYEKRCLGKCIDLNSQTKESCCDFTVNYGYDATLFNVGIVGVLCLVIVQGLQIRLSGPVVGAIFSVMGFAAYGVHPRNFLPLLLGTILASFLIYDSFGSYSVALAIFFSAGLGPIAGKYGIIAGIISGMIIPVIAPLMLGLQGGLGLYNMGFVTGFVALMVTPIFEAIKKYKDNKKTSHT